MSPPRVRTVISSRTWRWILVTSFLITLAVLAAGAWALRPARLKAEIIAALAARLHADVTIERFQLQLLPRIRLSGGGVTLRIKDHPDLPPFITIERFSMDLSPLAALRQHVDAIHVDGLRIQVPPPEAQPALASILQPPPSSGSFLDPTHVVVNRFLSHDAELLFVPRNLSQPALLFPIHSLEIDDLAFDRAMPFRATLTNPTPTGRIETSGTFGPWRSDDPAETPVAGDFVFLDADLTTINGIGGSLAAKGSYSGHLTAMDVEGETETPNFNLDLGGKPLPLETRFQASVDCTDGTTILRNVDATLVHTKMNIKGGVLNLAGPGNHAITLDVVVTEGRIEDLMRLVVDSPQPLMIGDVALRSKVALPPGKTRIPARLKLSGRFGLGKAQFNDAQVQSKLQELSRRSQGKKQDEVDERVLTSLQGAFTLSHGQFDLRDLSFHVPGAEVAMDGTYQLTERVLDFRGTLKMQTTLSKAVGGLKSIFLKVVDPLFRKEGAGTVLPIKLTGTLQEPKFEVDLGRMIRRN